MADYSLRTEACKSHLLTQTIKGILILFVSTPSGKGISICYYSLTYPNYFLSYYHCTLVFRSRRIRVLWISCNSLWLCIYFFLLFAAISSRSTILSPALFWSSYKNPIQLSSSSINPQGLVKSNIIITTAFFRISGFCSWENIC